VKRLSLTLLLLIAACAPALASFDILKSSTESPLVFLMLESADHITPLTGASPTVVISKDGGAFASPSGAVSEIGDGWYKVAANATDTGTLGPLLLHATATNGDPSDTVMNVVAYDPQSAANLGLTGVPTAAPNTSGGLLTVGTGSGQINPNGSGSVPVSAGTVTTVSGNVNGSVGSVTGSVGSVTAAVTTTQQVTSGTAQAGAASTITLASGSSATNSIFNNEEITLTGGTGIYQARTITGYVGSTKVATVSRAWATNPDNTTTYIITGDDSPAVDINGGAAVQSGTGTDQINLSSGNVALQSGQNVATVNSLAPPTNWNLESINGSGYVTYANAAPPSTSAIAAALLTNPSDLLLTNGSGYVTATNGGMSPTIVTSGTAQAGAASTITLAASGPVATNSFYNGAFVLLTGGTGAGQSRVITGYVGSSKVATLSTAWTTNPDSTSTYDVIAQPTPSLDQYLGVPVQSGTGNDQITTGGGIVSSVGSVNTTVSVIAPVEVGSYAPSEGPDTLVLGATASSWDSAGTIGAKINAAGSAGDPWTTALPGSYASGEAGYILGNYLTAVPPTSTQNAAAIWNALTASYTVAGSFGKLLGGLLFPTNFSSMLISSGGDVTFSNTSIGTVTNSVTADTTEFGGQSVVLDANNLPETDAADWNGNTISTVTPNTASTTVITNNDKTGYSLATAPPTAAQIAAAILVTPAHLLNTDSSGNVFLSSSDTQAAAEVWNALLASYDTASTFGNFLQQNSGGATAAQVWTYGTRTLTNAPPNFSTMLITTSGVVTASVVGRY
jgi:hypothetical protein